MTSRELRAHGSVQAVQLQLQHNYILKAAENDTSAALTNALKKRSADYPPWVMSVVSRQFAECVLTPNSGGIADIPQPPLGANNDILHCPKDRVSRTG
jgi:hypothetical protein